MALVVCKSCQEEFDTTEVDCPYCETTSDPKPKKWNNILTWAFSLIGIIYLFNLVYPSNDNVVAEPTVQSQYRPGMIIANTIPDIENPEVAYRAFRTCIAHVIVRNESPEKCMDVGIAWCNASGIQTSTDRTQFDYVGVMRTNNGTCSSNLNGVYEVFFTSIRNCQNEHQFYGGPPCQRIGDIPLP